MQDENFNDEQRDDPYEIKDDDLPTSSDPSTEDNVPAETASTSSETAEENSQPEAAKSDIGSDIIRGHINTIILRALYERDKYGYEIMNDIEQKSHGQYSLKQPTLYSALKRLENQGYIKAYWKTDEVTNGGRRKYFTLTESGKEITEKNLAEWEYSRTIIDSLISDRSFDFSQPAPTPVDFTILRNSVSRVPIVRSDETGRAEQTGSDEKNEKQLTEITQEQQPVIAQQTVTEQQSQTVQAEQVGQTEQSVTNQDLVTNEQTSTEQQSAEQQQIVDQQAQNAEQQVTEQTQPEQPKADEQAQLLEQQQIIAQQIIEQQQQVIEQQQQLIEQQNAYQQQVAQEAQQQEQQPVTSSLTPEQLAQAEARRRAHENYLRLISEPVRVQEPQVEDVVPNHDSIGGDQLLYTNKPETERDYKNLIDGIFRKAISNGSVQTFSQVEQPKPATPDPKPRIRIVDRGRADGVAVATSQNFDSDVAYATKTTYNKGATMLKCSAVVLAIILIEFVCCFIFLNQLKTTWIYPVVLLLIGLVQFAVFGIIALQGYQKNCVRPTTNGYISSCVIITIIAILIICAASFLLNINATLISDVMKMIVIPSITALNITVFAVCFKLFLR